MRDGLFSVLFTLLAAAFAIGCFYSAKGIGERQSRARYVAIAIGVLVWIFGALILLDVYLPERPGTFHGDDGFAVLLVPFLIVPGAWLFIYLNLPHVRRQFSCRQNKER